MERVRQDGEPRGDPSTEPARLKARSTTAPGMAANVRYVLPSMSPDGKSGDGGPSSCKTAFNFIAGRPMRAFSNVAAGQVNAPMVVAPAGPCSPNYRRTVFHGIKSPKACFQ